MKKFCFSKIFNYFGILQQVVFVHFRRNTKKGRAKEIFLLTALNALFVALHKSVIYSFYNFDPEAEIIELDFKLFSDSIEFKYDESKIQDLSIPLFEEFMCKELRKLWPLVDVILDVFEDSKRKGEADVNKVLKQLEKYDYVAYVDGAAVGKVIGYGGVIYDKNNKIVTQIKGQVKGKHAKAIRNIAGELAGTLFIIKKAINLGIKKICLVFDYLGIQKYFTGDWLPKDPFSKEYVLKLREYNSVIDIDFLKVKSHTGIPGNEYVDKLAKKAIYANDPPKEKKNFPIYPQEMIDYLARSFKTIFKILTIIEMVYLNNNLNDLDVQELILNLMIKYQNLNDFTEKNFKLATIEENLDPIDDHFMDVINDLL